MQAVETANTRAEGRLTGKVALVTGAAAGMGAAICARYLAEGASVIAADVNGAGLARYADVEQVAAVTGDVGQSDDVEAMVKTAVEKFGGLDVLCNNAGIMDAFLPVGEVTDAVWEKVLAVNLTGPMKLCRAAVRVMSERGGGSIINIASVGGLVGARAGAAYTASKHGVIGLTKNVAAVYGKDGIRCNAICPGAVDTGIALGGEPSARGYEALNKTLGANPRLGKPEEIAALAAFLASDESSFINGAVIVADGGWLAP